MTEAKSPSSSKPLVDSIIKGLSDQLKDEHVANSLDLVDITFTCKVCGLKEKTLQDLAVHMKDGQCTTKKRGRGRPKKSEMTPQVERKPRPKKEVSPAFIGPSTPSERVTRVKSGALKWKSVAELYNIKQEAVSSEDEEEDEKRPKKARIEGLKSADMVKKEVGVDEEEVVEMTLQPSEIIKKSIKVVPESSQGSTRLNKKPALSGKVIRIPIGSFKDGESKIIALKTLGKDENGTPLKGSILHIREVEKSRAVMEVLGEAVVGEEGEEEGGMVVREVKEDGAGLKEDEGLKEQDEMEDKDAKMEDGSKSEDMDKTNLEPIEEDGVASPGENDTIIDIKPYNPQTKRKYTKLPSTTEIAPELTTGPVGLKCSKCVQRWFHTAKELDIHFRLHLTGPEVGYKCDKCSYKTQHWGRMMYHLVTHPEYAEELKGMHMMKNIYGKFTCPVCGREFELKCNLSAHHNKVHSQEQKYCPECDQTFADLDEKRFERHLDKCKGQELQCEFCPYKTSVRSNMRLHLRVHSGEGFDCKECGKLFPTKQRWQVHVQKHQDERPRFPCEFCKADFCSKDAVKKHIQRLHIEKEVLFKCAICAYSTKQEQDFRKHLKCVHEKKFRCPREDCGYSTNKEEQLTSHEDYHDPARIYRCTYANCYNAFSSHKNLANHMQGIHKIGCKHQCPICMKFFKKKTVLLRHLVSHTNERPYSCHECGLTFTCHSTYYRHRAKTGHDARREGVASVPQNITIQYMDTPVEETAVDFDSIAVAAQQVLHQEEADGTSENQHVVTIDATQFDQLQQQQQQQQYYHFPQQHEQLQQVEEVRENFSMEEIEEEQLRVINTKDDEAQEQVTYVVYNGEDPQFLQAGDDDTVRVLEAGDDETFEAVELENANDEQFINLDLPNGPALVKMDNLGGLMVINANGTNKGSSSSSDRAPQYVIHEEVSAGHLLELPEDETVEEIVCQEIDVRELQAAAALVQGGGESDAALSMLQLQGGGEGGLKEERAVI